MPASNVLKFPKGQPDGWRLKLFIMIFYGTIAFLLVSSRFSEGGLGLLLIWGVLYHFFIRARIHQSQYFQQNKVLIIILLAFAIGFYQFQGLLMLGIAGLYALLVGRSGKEPPYFLRFHVLTALIGNFLLLAAFLLINGAVNLLLSTLSLLPVITLLNMSLLGGIGLIAIVGLVGFNVWLAFSALMGRTPYLPYVTDNVRHLV